MVLYRRNRQAGGTYFFTVTLRNRQSNWLTLHIDDLRNAYRKALKARPFTTVAIVVLPDHLHAVWTLPEGDADYSGRWRSIKAEFTRTQARADRVRRAAATGSYDLWQSRFWEHSIRDEIDLQRHVDYIHFNPVKHGWVERVSDWPHSSFHRYVRHGLLPNDWGGNRAIDPDLGEFGE